MNKKRIVKILGILLFVTLSFVLLSKPIIPVSEVYAVSCPSGMDEDSQECLDYLQDQYAKIQGQLSTLKKKLNNEAYQQLSLQEKINYINEQVIQTERIIKSLEVQIAANDTEIKLLQKDIQTKEDYIAVLRQETNILEQTVNQRITESYKYSFVGPLEIFLDVKSLSSALRRTKYLIATRSQDIVSLEEYSFKIENLREEENKLAEQKAKVQLKRNDIEDEKIELANETNNLKTQRTEQSRLLAESKAKQATLLAEYQKNRKIQSDLDAQITAYVNAHMGEMIDEGYVPKGALIGYIYPYGNSCSGSTGPHLHFAISTTSSGTFYPNVDIYNGGYLRIGSPSVSYGWPYPYVLAGKYPVPIGGSGIIITQDYHDKDDDYKKDSNEPNYYATDLSKVGGSANAPVLAVASGTLYRLVDPCKQDYVIIRHSNGWRTMYLHIKYSR